MMDTDGRTICYEGDDPIEFCEDIAEMFWFDPSADPAWGKHWMNGDPNCPDPFGRKCWFHCPAEYLDDIYASGAWRLGS